MLRMIKGTLALAALVMATLACSLGANTANQPAEQEITPISVIELPTRTPFPQADTTDEATEDEPATEADTNGGLSQPAADTGSVVVVAPAILPACTPRTDWTATYTVVRGDTLASIARRANTTYPTLAAGNCLADPSRIEAGWVLRLPNPIVVQPPPVSPPQIVPTVRIAHVTLGTAQQRTLTVAGEGYSLFEGSVVVELLDANRTVISQQPLTVNPQAQFQTTFTVPANITAQGFIYAYAISPRDGSVAASDTVNVRFDFGGPGLGGQVSFDLWGQVLTPRPDGTVIIRGTTTYQSIGAVVVQLRDRNNNVVPNTERRRTLSANGTATGWDVALTVPADVYGEYTLYVRAETASGETLAEAIEDVAVAQRTTAMTATHTGAGYAITYPQGWYRSDQNNQTHLATYAPGNQPPGAAWSELTADVSVQAVPYTAAASLDELAANDQASNANSAYASPSTAPIALSGGMTGLHLTYTGGTGKAIHVIYADTGTSFLMMTALGNWELTRPIVTSVRPN